MNWQGNGSGCELIQHRTAVEMARTFQNSTATIRRLLDEVRTHTDTLGKTFLDVEEVRHAPFEIRFGSGYGRGYGETLDSILLDMKKTAWRILVDRMGLKNVMSIKKRGEFEKQLESGDLPDICPETIGSIIATFGEQAKDFAKEAAIEVFEILRPHNSHYKTNDAFRVGRRVILTWMVESGWGRSKFRPNYDREKRLVAIDGVFHILDGKGIMKEHKGPLCQAIYDTQDGKGETEYFRFRCFKNHNLHLEFKRLDLVKELNGLAAGEFVLGDDME